MWHSQCKTLTACCRAANNRRGSIMKISLCAVVQCLCQQCADYRLLMASPGSVLGFLHVHLPNVNRRGPSDCSHWIWADDCPARRTDGGREGLLSPKRLSYSHVVRETFRAYVIIFTRQMKAVCHSKTGIQERVKILFEDDLIIAWADG